MHTDASSLSPLSFRVALVAFAEADWEALTPTREVLANFEIAAERSPLSLLPGGNPDFAEFAGRVNQSGIHLVIVAAREARLTRAFAAGVTAPVIRVPIAADPSRFAALAALTDDAPAGETTAFAPRAGSFATVALGEAGARNAALLAVSILALTDDRLRAAWHAFRAEQTKAVLAQPPPAG